MLEDSPGITLFLFALPMILGNLFQQFYNMVDSMIVGQFVGEDALAAVGASYALTNVFVMIAIGGGIGAPLSPPSIWGRRRQEDENLRVYGAAYLSGHGNCVGGIRLPDEPADPHMAEYAGKYSGGGRNLSGNLFSGHAFFVYV